MKTRFLLVFVILLPLVSGCLATRNFSSPKERPRQNTAYTLNHGEFNVGLGLLGQGSYDMLLKAGFAAGIGGKGGKGEVGINLGHAALSIVNVYGKYNFIDKKWWALSARIEVTWIYPKLIWAVPAEDREALGDLNVLSIPIEIGASFPVADWVGLHLFAGYRTSVLFGEIGEDTIFLNRDVGSRQVYLLPQVTFYIAKKLKIFIDGRILLWGMRREKVVDTTQVDTGIFVGVRSAGWQEVDQSSYSFVRAGVDMKFGKVTYLRLWVMFNGSLSEDDIISSPIVPGLEISWRF